MIIDAKIWYQLSFKIAVRIEQPNILQAAVQSVRPGIWEFLVRFQLLSVTSEKLSFMYILQLVIYVLVEK